MGFRAKIPTLLGLAIIIGGLAAGVALVLRNDSLKLEASQSLIPKNIIVSNVSDNSVSIYWQTDKPTSGFITAGTTSTLGSTFHDDRDSKNTQNYQLHFVTLSNLTPNTLYYYRIKSGSIAHPWEETLSFKTLSPLPAVDQQPLVGTIFNSSGQPAPEAIITLDDPQIQKAAAITRKDGNFILSLTSLRDKTMTQTFDLTQLKTPLKLIIFDFEKSSNITLQPPFTYKVLPPIILGEDSDFTPSSLAQPLPTITNVIPTSSASSSANILEYDLNRDNIIDAQDLSVILKNFGKNPKNPLADLNKDKVVDQKDVDLFKQNFPENSQQ